MGFPSGHGPGAEEGQYADRQKITQYGLTGMAPGVLAAGSPGLRGLCVLWRALTVYSSTKRHVGASTSSAASG